MGYRSRYGSSIAQDLLSRSLSVSLIDRDLLALPNCDRRAILTRPPLPFQSRTLLTHCSPLVLLVTDHWSLTTASLPSFPFPLLISTPVC